MTEPKPTYGEMTPAQVERATDALADRAFWLAVRDALLRLVDAVEDKLHLPSERRNVVLRSKKRR